MRKVISLIASIAFVCATFATNYYVDSSITQNNLDGTTKVSAWNSLLNIKGKAFQPGDTIYFRRGSVFTGNIQFQGSGAKGNPIVVDVYGNGDKPKINGNGWKNYTLLLENEEYWEVNRLYITNTGPKPTNGRRGVIVRAKNCGDKKHIYLNELTVSDVNGSNIKKQGGGSAILFENGDKEIKSRFVDIKIENCHLLRCTRNGINFKGNAERDSWYPSLGVIIRKNLLEQIPGDGIVPIGCDGALIEYNVMRNCPDLPAGEAAAGIWPWSCDNTIIQYNEVSDHKAKSDGQGFDSDFNCNGTIFQYNYSHDNDGGFMLVCNNGLSYNTPINMGTKNTIIRFNISVNDGIRQYNKANKKWASSIFHISGPCDNTQIYNNTIILPKKVENMNNFFVDFGNWGGKNSTNTRFFNNIIYCQDSIAVRDSLSGGHKFENNLYFGPFTGNQLDRKAIFSNPAFVGLPTNTDKQTILNMLKLLPNSPCIGRGIEPKTRGNFDFWGNKLPKKMNIGAYQGM